MLLDIINTINRLEENCLMNITEINYIHIMSLLREGCSNVKGYFFFATT